ncbi:MAG TPA: hypothetical protein VFM50_14215 [Nocardioidaceae bacterium]|nr:hypothetical protein [Nocardioidaceae bacterium]
MAVTLSEHPRGARGNAAGEPPRARTRLTDMREGHGRAAQAGRLHNRLAGRRAARARARRRPGWLAALLVVVLAGACGGQNGTGGSGGGSGDGSAGGAVLFGDCRTSDPALAQAHRVAVADLDGTGRPEKVGFVPASADGPCAGALVATVGGTTRAVRVDDVRGPLQSATVVHLRGSGQELVMLRGKNHPRGGYLLHLYAAGSGGLSELLVDGRPVLGFVATDGGAAPATATCTPGGGIATWRATAHQPPGIVLAWDVRRSTYEVEGTQLRRTDQQLVREAVADPLLREQMPALFDQEAYFADCRTAA